jgi:hypothetical protein
MARGARGRLFAVALQPAGEFLLLENVDLKLSELIPDSVSSFHGTHWYDVDPDGPPGQPG